MRDTWTQELETYVKNLWDEGVSSKGIAETVNAEFGLSLTRNAIIGKVHRMGLKAHTDKPTRQYAARAPKWEPAPPPPPPPPPNGPVDFNGLTNETCRWPMNLELDAPATTFCGKSANLVLGQPYCAFHTRVSLGAPSRPMRAPRDI